MSTFQSDYSLIPRTVWNSKKKCNRFLLTYSAFSRQFSVALSLSAHKWQCWSDGNIAFFFSNLERICSFFSLRKRIHKVMHVRGSRVECNVCTHFVWVQKCQSQTDTQARSALQLCMLFGVVVVGVWLWDEPSMMLFQRTLCPVFFPR